MKSEKGVTLISIMIYVIAVFITISIITIAFHFITNNNNDSKERIYINECAKLEKYFLEEANIENNRILELSPKVSDSCLEQYVLLSSKNQYTYVKNNKAIYKNDIKIAEQIDECEFSEVIKDGKSAIKIAVKIQNSEKTIEYIFKR